MAKENPPALRPAGSRRVVTRRLELENRLDFHSRQIAGCAGLDRAPALLVFDTEIDLRHRAPDQVDDADHVALLLASSESHGGGVILHVIVTSLQARPQCAGPPMGVAGADAVNPRHRRSRAGRQRDLLDASGRAEIRHVMAKSLAEDRNGLERILAECIDVAAGLDAVAALLDMRDSG